VAATELGASDYRMLSPEEIEGRLKKMENQESRLSDLFLRQPFSSF
jgi:hypothetical protein